MAGRTAIGLDIGSTGVRAAEITVAKGQVTLKRFGQVALPIGVVRDGEVTDPEAVASALRSLWASAKFSTKNVVLGISNQKVFVRLVDIPWVPDSDLRTSLKYQVADLVPMPIDEAVLDFVPLGEVGTENERLLRGLLVAASEDMVLGAIRATQLAGLKTTSVDLTAFAVLRSIGASSAPDAGPEAVVDIGAKVTNVVLHSQGVPQFVRILLLGGEDITSSLVERLGISVAEAEALKRDGAALAQPGSSDAARIVDTCLNEFVDEIRGSVDYFLATSGSQPLSRIVLSGGGSLAPNLSQKLSTSVRAPVEFAKTFSTLTVGRTGLAPEQIQYVEPMAAISVGLAMGAV